jgi:hypothetical protein
VPAYNLLNLIKRFALPPEVKHGSLQSIQLKLFKIGARVIRHARKITFHMAEGAVSQGLKRARVQGAGVTPRCRALLAINDLDLNAGLRQQNRR